MSFISHRAVQSLIVLSLLMVGFVFSSTTVSACTVLGSGSQVPTNYGAPYSFYGSKPLLIKSGDCTESTAGVIVGDRNSDTYVYGESYYWSGSRWVKVNLSGSPKQGAWIAREGTGSIPLVADRTWYVAYTCQNVSGQWRCGCGDAECTEKLWQVQGYEREGVSVASAGQGGGGGGSIPSAVRTVNVSNSSQLSSALSSAKPGDHIVLANGSYSGFTVSRSGQSGKPIVVRAGNVLGPKVSGRISVNGNHIFIVGMTMQNNGIYVAGNNVRVTRNTILANSIRSHGIYVDKQAQNAEIDHNEYTGTVAYMGKDPGYDVILMRYTCSQQANHYLHHNYIHDVRMTDNKNSNVQGILSGFGTICSGYYDKANANTVIEYNLISNLNSGSAYRTKSGNNTIRFNTCIKCRSVQTRHGPDNEWIANWFEISNKATFYENDNKLIGNRFIGGAAEIRAGRPENNFLTGDNALVVGNIGNLIIGGGPDNFYVPVKNVRVEAHQTGNGCGKGTITCDRQQGTTFSATTNTNIPKAFKLTPSQVGPNAPTAPRI